MRITIINSDKNEKRYTREELEEFVAQLKDGTYRQQYINDYTKEVCFAAEWTKQSGELKAKSTNSLILLSLENLRIMKQNEQFQQVNNYDQMIELTYLSPENTPNDAGFVALQTIMKRLEQLFPTFSISKGTDVELGRRLTKMGYKHKRSNKGSVFRVEEI